MTKCQGLSWGSFNGCSIVRFVVTPIIIRSIVRFVTIIPICFSIRTINIYFITIRTISLYINSIRAISLYVSGVRTISLYVSNSMIFPFNRDIRVIFYNNSVSVYRINVISSVGMVIMSSITFWPVDVPSMTYMTMNMSINMVSIGRYIVIVIPPRI